MAVFQLRVIAHEYYHYGSKESSAICLDNNLKTSVVGFTIHEKAAQSSSDSKYYVINDKKQESLAGIFGSTIALVIYGIGIVFIILFMSNKL